MSSGPSPQRPMQLLSLTIPRKPSFPCAPIKICVSTTCTYHPVLFSGLHVTSTRTDSECQETVSYRWWSMLCCSYSEGKKAIPMTTKRDTPTGSKVL